MIEVAALAEQALPPSGRHLLATFDDETVVVWQVQGRASVRLSLPSQLVRCAWGREPILAVTLKRGGLDALLRQAVHTTFEPAVYASAAAWRLATRFGNVSVTWHADRDPGGAELARQTPRLGLRHGALASFTDEWVVRVDDWTPWAVRHREERGADLPVPVVRPYPVPEVELDRLTGRGSDDVR